MTSLLVFASQTEERNRPPPMFHRRCRGWVQSRIWARPLFAGSGARPSTRLIPHSGEEDAWDYGRHALLPEAASATTRRQAHDSHDEGHCRSVSIFLQE